MNELEFLLLFAGILFTSLVVLWSNEAIRLYRRYRGARLIICPETKNAAAVKVAAGKVAFKALAQPELRLKDCTRWPERGDCGQYCLSQVEAAPEDCLVSNIVAAWYQGQACAFCGREFPHLRPSDHRPALLAPAGKITPWYKFPAEQLPDLFQTHKPVCWQCGVAEGFRHDHPELVTDR